MNRLRYPGNQFDRSATRFFKLLSGGWYHSGVRNYSYSEFGGWKLEPNSPIHQDLVGITSLSGDVHVAGGRLTSSELTLKHTRRRAGVWDFAEDMPSPGRTSHSVARAAGDMFILGGATPLQSPVSDINTFDRFRASTQTWDVEPRPEVFPQDIARAGLIGHSDHILQAGGVYFPFDNASIYATATSYSLVTQHWTSREPMPSVLASHSYAGIGEDSYTFLGYNGAFINQTRRFNLAMDAWSQSLPRPGAAYTLSHAMEISGRIVSYSHFESVRPSVLAEFDGLSWRTLDPIGDDVGLAGGSVQGTCGL